MSSEPPASERVVLRTTVSERYLGLARWLALGAFALIFAPSVIAWVLVMLGKLTGLGLLLAASKSISGLFGFGVLGGLILAFSSAIVAGPTVRGWRGAADVKVNAGQLMFQHDGLSHSIPIATIRDAVVLTPPTTGLELWLSNGNSLTLELGSEEEAYALLEQLGFAPSERRVTVRLATPQRQLAAGCIGLPAFHVLLMPIVFLLHGMGMSSLFIGTFYTLMPALLTMLLYFLRKPPEIVIGTEGLLVRRAFRKKYYPYAGLGQVVADGGALKFGEPGAMKTVARGDKAPVQAAAKRIADARAVYERGAAELSLAELFDVGGRDVGEWQKAIRAIAKSKGYRNAAISPETLTALVENPEMTPRQRISAAMCLRIASPEARPRIRIAAEACADDALRAALEATAAEEEMLDIQKIAPIVMKRQEG